MRKWMRERLQRRKKKTDKPPAEAAPAPLQPAFYGIEPPAESPQAEEPQPSSEPVSSAVQEAPEPQAEPVETQPRRNASESDPRKRRRRRGRGRGGRSGQAQRKTDSSAPPVASASSEVGEASEVPPVPSPAEPTTGAEPSAAGEAPAATPRPSRGTVILAIGLPGSGKSSWFKRHNITPLSSDLLRSLLFDDPTEQRFQDLVFSNLRSMLKAADCAAANELRGRNQSHIA